LLLASLKHAAEKGSTLLDLGELGRKNLPESGGLLLCLVSKEAHNFVPYRTEIDGQGTCAKKDEG